jgi:hypothetical protein
MWIDKKTFGISKKSHLTKLVQAFAIEHGEQNGKGKLTKQMNGRHGDGRMQR